MNHEMGTVLLLPCQTTLHKRFIISMNTKEFNPLNAELNPICHLLALLGAHHVFHVSVLRVKHTCRLIFFNSNILEMEHSVITKVPMLNVFFGTSQ